MQVCPQGGNGNGPEDDPVGTPLLCPSAVSQQKPDDHQKQRDGEQLGPVLRHAVARERENGNRHGEGNRPVRTAGPQGGDQGSEDRHSGKQLGGCDHPGHARRALAQCVEAGGEPLVGDVTLTRRREGVAVHARDAALVEYQASGRQVDEEVIGSRAGQPRGGDEGSESQQGDREELAGGGHRGVVDPPQPWGGRGPILHQEPDPSRAPENRTFGRRRGPLLGVPCRGVKLAR